FSGLDGLILYEGCALWLFRRLKELGVIERSEQSGFFSWLAAEARRLTAANLAVDAQTEELVRWLEQENIPHVLLKGAARRAASAIYPLADARATLDIDVLVPQALADDVWHRLRARGYHDPIQPPPEHHHLASLVNQANVPVEVHTSTSTL